MKQEKDLFKKDLSNQKGSYTKSLNDNMNLLNDLGSNASIDLKTYVARVLAIIAPAHDTNAKRNFIMILQKQRTKTDAMIYVMNAYMRGCGMEVL